MIEDTSPVFRSLQYPRPTLQARRGSHGNLPTQNPSFAVILEHSSVGFPNKALDDHPETTEILAKPGCQAVSHTQMKAWSTWSAMP